MRRHLVDDYDADRRQSLHRRRAARQCTRMRGTSRPIRTSASCYLNECQRRSAVSASRRKQPAAAETQADGMAQRASRMRQEWYPGAELNRRNAVLQARREPVEVIPRSPNAMFLLRSGLRPDWPRCAPAGTGCLCPGCVPRDMARSSPTELAHRVMRKGTFRQTGNHLSWSSGWRPMPVT